MYLTAPRTAAVALTGSVVLLVLLAHHHPPSGRLDRWEESHKALRDQVAASPVAEPAQALSKDAAPSREASISSDELAARGAASTAPSVMPASTTFRTPGSDAATAMIIRTGTASIEVASVDSALPRVRQLAAQVGGYIANSTVQGGHEQIRTATVEIKTPAQNFDRLVSALAPIGKLESVNVNADDVGEEYVDIDARVTNDRRLEDRLIQLLATRTGKLKDVLDVERELARVREEMERYQGRLRYLHSHAAVSTLSINVHEPVPIIANTGPNPIAAAAREAWHNFVALLALTVASLGVIVPVGAVAAALWLLLRRRQRVPPPATVSAAPSGD